MLSFARGAFGSSFGLNFPVGGGVTGGLLHGAGDFLANTTHAIFVHRKSPLLRLLRRLCVPLVATSKEGSVVCFVQCPVASVVAFTFSII